jgi:hypothetical protein
VKTDRAVAFDVAYRVWGLRPWPRFRPKPGTSSAHLVDTCEPRLSRRRLYSRSSHSCHVFSATNVLNLLPSQLDRLQHRTVGVAVEDDIELLDDLFR